MIHKLKILRGESTDPHYNLAVEQVLLESVEEGECILYLWRNANTVVIGRNQNAWKECRGTLLYDEGGKLARRLSGGGAVGRKLDFLLQEMNREANTTGSKCSDVKVARIVVDIKAELEKIREQTQNIE